MSFGAFRALLSRPEAQEEIRLLNRRLSTSYLNSLQLSHAAKGKGKEGLHLHRVVGPVACSMQGEGESETALLRPHGKVSSNPEILLLSRPQTCNQNLSLHKHV